MVKLTAESADKARSLSWGGLTGTMLGWACRHHQLLDFMLAKGIQHKWLRTDLLAAASTSTQQALVMMPFSGRVNMWLAHTPPYVLSEIRPCASSPLSQKNAFEQFGPVPSMCHK